MSLFWLPGSTEASKSSHSTPSVRPHPDLSPKTTKALLLANGLLHAKGRVFRLPDLALDLYKRVFWTKFIGTSPALLSAMTASLILLGLLLALPAIAVYLWHAIQPQYLTDIPTVPGALPLFGHALAFFKHVRENETVS